MSQQALYWIDDAWKSLEVENAENLDNLDSTDFAMLGHKHFKSEITDLPGVATTAQDGFMSAADKTKLTNIAVNANNYTHPNDANTRHVTDAEKTKWNGKADAHSHPYAATSHPHTIENVTGLRAELDSIKSSTGGTKIKRPSETVRLSTTGNSITIIQNSGSIVTACVYLGRIRMTQNDVIRVSTNGFNCNAHNGVTTVGVAMIVATSAPPSKEGYINGISNSFKGSNISVGTATTAAAGTNDIYMSFSDGKMFDNDIDIYMTISAQGTYSGIGGNQTLTPNMQIKYDE